MLNRGFTFKERLNSAADGQTLLEFLTHRYAHSSAGEWQQRIDEGQVLLDEQPVKSGAVLEAGQRLIWDRPPWEEPEAPVTFAVLYQDDDLLAVAKPSGLPTLPGAGYLENTLLLRMRRHAPEAAPVHRLGRGTSGLVLFGRNAATRRKLSADWREGRVKKDYVALAAGTPAQSAFRVETPIGPVPYPPLGTVNAASAEGKPSRSDVRLLEQRVDAFVCAVRIATGRPHQIRIHLATSGHPLVGDSLYSIGGKPIPDGQARPGDGGYLLHAARLELAHPATGRRLELWCAPPPALRARVTSNISTSSPIWMLKCWT